MDFFDKRQMTGQFGVGVDESSKKQKSLLKDDENIKNSNFIEEKNNDEVEGEKKE